MHTDETTASTFVTVPAHFDGKQILLDADVELEPNTHLLVTILPTEPGDDALVWGAMKQSEAAFARVWDNDEDAVYDNL
jgi:hypothetical protein